MTVTLCDCDICHSYVTQKLCDTCDIVTLSHISQKGKLADCDCDSQCDRYVTCHIESLRNCDNDSVNESDNDSGSDSNNDSFNESDSETSCVSTGI